MVACRNARGIGEYNLSVNKLRHDQYFYNYHRTEQPYLDCTIIF